MEEIFHFCGILPVFIDRSNSSVRTGAIECEETLQLYIPSDPEALLVSKAIKRLNTSSVQKISSGYGDEVSAIKTW